MNTPTLNDLFDRRLDYPDMTARKRLARLVGVDDAKSRLTKLLGVLVNPEGPKAWANRYHQNAITLIDYVERQPPLIILAGDVGTGKTELAETIGDAVAQQEGISITLYPLSLATRGSGRVGEMTSLLSAAFDVTVEAATKLKRPNGGKAGGAIILLIDEADAVTQSRESAQMHHEDRAGVNAFIRGVDRMAGSRLPAATILCTNRLSSIDPAVQRRAAAIFEFNRPNDVQRRIVIENSLTEVGFTTTQIDKIVELTGVSKESPYGFTFSDLTQRLLPTLVMDAYPNNPITFQRATEVIGKIKPTPPFRDEVK